MSRRLLLLPLSLGIALLGACGGDDADEQAASPAADRPDMTLDGEGEGRSFALVRARDTLLVERYTREGNRVQGVMRDPTGGRVEYETVHGGAGEESTMRISVTPAGPAPTAPMVSVFTLRGDSVILTHERPDSSEVQRESLPAGTLPYMAPSIGMMDLLVHSARGIAGDSGQVGLLAASLSQNPVHVRPLVMWRGDTAWVIGNEMNQFRLVYENGELASFQNDPQQMRGVPLTGTVDAAPAAAPPAGDAETAVPATP